GAPDGGAAVGVGGVDLGEAAVAPARPGDRGAVRGEPRVAGLAAVGGQPPGTATAGGSQPDVVFGDEGEQVIVNVRKAEITGGGHANHATGACPAWLCRRGRRGRRCERGLRAGATGEEGAADGAWPGRTPGPAAAAAGCPPAGPGPGRRPPRAAGRAPRPSRPG